MEMAASEVFGCPLNRIITTEPLDRDNMKQEAIEIAKKEYPGWQLRYTKPVCYSYPKEGVMLTLVKPGAKEEKPVIVDTFTSSVVPLKQPTRDGDSGVWSLYDKIPSGKRANMVENWNINARNIATERPATMDLSTKSYKKLNVKLYAQEESTWCAAAVGQMIAEYYGVTHSQSFVAECMGGDGATISEQLVYYHDNLNKYGSAEHDASFNDEKGEIDANRPLRSGIEWHARCAIGYSDIILDLIYINDPWPENVGLGYWEWWGLRTHTTDIYVED